MTRRKRMAQRREVAAMVPSTTYTVEDALEQARRARHGDEGPDEDVAILRAQVTALLASLREAYSEGYADGCEAVTAWSPEAADAAWAASATAETVREWHGE